MSDQTAYTASALEPHSTGYRDVVIREPVNNLTAGRLLGSRRHTSRGVSVQPEDRARIRSYWLQAKNAAAAMARSAEADGAEVFGQAIRVRDALDGLWGLRRHREDLWVSILDLTQSVLKQIANKIDDVKPEWCRLLRDIIALHLSPATKTQQDLVEATRVVLDIGFDPYPGLAPLGRVSPDGTS